MKVAKIEVSVLDMAVLAEFFERVDEFISEYAWHARYCAAIDADGEWHTGNSPCDCGYDEARSNLWPD